MLTKQRQELILKLLEENGSVTVTEVKDLLDASESTVRRDITALDKEGKLVKVFGGAVAAPGQVMVPRDLAYDEDGGEAPAGVAYADFPEATRPGYAFKGWYWPETKWQAGQEVPKTDEHGRAVLSEAAGPVVPADGSEGEMSYDDLRAHSGDTLYAKWEVAPSVRILLDGARDADMQWGIHLWFWPGRGYAMTQPVADMELRADAVITQCRDFIAGPKDHFLLSTFEDRLDALDFLTEEEKNSYKEKNLIHKLSITLIKPSLWWLDFFTLFFIMRS